MEATDSSLNGAVIVSHQVLEGKHQYEVKQVIKQKKNKNKMFVRTGDKLMKINDLDLQDVTPEDLVQQISAGSPMLTVHKPEKKQEVFVSEEDDVLEVFNKETTVLSFSWEMVREEEGGVVQERVENEANAEKDVCPGEAGGEDTDLLVVTMTQTSISLVSGRGCSSDAPCKGCHRTGCTYNDIIVVSKSSAVTLIPRGDVSFRQEKLAEVLIKHVPTHRYLRGICSDGAVCSSPNPEKINIYYYKSNDVDPTFKGMPVVLNLTGSNCFIRCCRNENKVFLQTEICDKQRLKQISKKDECTFSFIFYMKANRTKQRRFESALYRGWFMQIAPSDAVKMTEPGEERDSSFLFIIQMSPKQNSLFC